MKNIASLTLLVFLVHALQAQVEYQKKSEKEGIVISYNWKPSIKKEADSPLELDIMLQNNNDFAIDVAFTVVFFDTGEIIEESPVIKLCFKPGQILKGKKYGLGLVSENITNEQIKSKGFDWDLEEFKAKKTNGCD